MSDHLQRDQHVVLCDMCTEKDRKPALKTCMKCEISMCVQHLQAHLTTPVLLQTHPLTEPMASGYGGLGSTTKCPQHGKLLEYYCLDDMTCVCVSCAIEDQHRLHNMKNFSTAHRELLEKLSAEQQDLQVKTDDENVSLEKWEKSEREKLARSSVRLIKAVTNLRDIALTSVQSSVSARMVSIKTSKSSMQAAQKEKDAFRFLQMYSQVQQDMEQAKAVDLRKGMEPGSDRDKLVQEIKQNGEKMVKQAGHFWGSLLTLVDPENHQELINTSSDLIFEPQSLSRGMSLSTDRRKVFYTSGLGQCSACVFFIESTQSLSLPDLHRCVIGFSEHCDWTIGVCDQLYVKELRDGEAYGLCCKGNQLSSLTTEYVEVTDSSGPFKKPNRTVTEERQTVSLQAINPPDEDMAKQIARPQRVEVVWDFPNSLTFNSMINQHQRRKIVTVTINTTIQDLFPFVCLKVEESQGSSSKPRTSRQGAALFSSQPQCQKQWTCSCGRVYIETGDTYSHGVRSYQKSSQTTCYCGKVIGALPITEVLCELL